jgi:translation initiation factor 1 (eIF-1/SUI1)
MKKKMHESSSALKQGLHKSGTIIEGIDPTQSDLPNMFDELNKSTFACGGESIGRVYSAAAG